MFGLFCQETITSPSIYSSQRSLSAFWKSHSIICAFNKFRMQCEKHLCTNYRDKSGKLSPSSYEILRKWNDITCCALLLIIWITFIPNLQSVSSSDEFQNHLSCNMIWLQRTKFYKAMAWSRTVILNVSGIHSIHNHDHGMLLYFFPDLSDEALAISNCQLDLHRIYLRVFHRNEGFTCNLLLLFPKYFCQNQAIINPIVRTFVPIFIVQ